MPLDNSQSQWLDFFTADFLVEAGYQCAAPNGVHGLVRDGPGLDRYAQVKPQLQEQFVEDVFLTSVRLDVVNAIEQGFFQVVAVRLPSADVGGVELEYAEAKVADNQVVLGLEFLSNPPDTFFW